MGCGVYWQQIREIERALGTMRKFGIDELSAPYQELFGIRGKLMAQVGVKFPRTVSLLVKLIGLSPGVISLWHDVESGWMSEGRTRPGAHPVYRAIPDELAMAILKRELSPEQEQFLMTPDPYIGE